jgi:hypothetical protein
MTVYSQQKSTATAVLFCWRKGKNRDTSARERERAERRLWRRKRRRTSEQIRSIAPEGRRATIFARCKAAMRQERIAPSPPIGKPPIPGWLSYWPWRGAAWSLCKLQVSSECGWPWRNLRPSGASIFAKQQPQIWWKGIEAFLFYDRMEWYDMATIWGAI